MTDHLDHERDGGSARELNSSPNSAHGPKEKEGRITTAGRKALPTSKFALPPDRFPIDTSARARNALARASQGVKVGTLSSSQESTIKAAVRRAFPDIEVA